MWLPLEMFLLEKRLVSKLDPYHKPLSKLKLAHFSTSFFLDKLEACFQICACAPTFDA